MLRKIFGHEKKEAAGYWRKLRKEKLYDLYSAVNIIHLIKKRKLMWVSHVVRTEEKKGAYRISVG